MNLTKAAFGVGFLFLWGCGHQPVPEVDKFNIEWDTGNVWTDIEIKDATVVNNVLGLLVNDGNNTKWLGGAKRISQNKPTAQQLVFAINQTIENMARPVPVAQASPIPRPEEEITHVESRVDATYPRQYTQTYIYEYPRTPSIDVIVVPPSSSRSTPVTRRRHGLTQTYRSGSWENPDSSPTDTRDYKSRMHTETEKRKIDRRKQNR